MSGGWVVRVSFMWNSMEHSVLVVPQKGEKANVIFLCTLVVVISILSWSANFFSCIYYCICILDIFRSLEKPSINNWHLKWLCHSATLPLEEKDSCLGLFKHSILPNPYETLPSKWAFSRPWCSRLLNWERVTLFCGVSMGLKVWRGLKGLQGAKSQHLDMSANRPLHSCFWGLQQYNSQFVCIDLIL